MQQSDWARDRISALKAIYGFTPAGEEWLDGYDLRQMLHQPAWFGSFGYGSWAGAGEAVPRSVLHEISHSYWGAFSVSHRPDLRWEDPDGPGVAPALAAYRDDLRRFLVQPPDRFEPLRDRFRNLPQLDTGEYPDLFHFGEANLLFMTGGNYQLVPPLLQPYFAGFLAPDGVTPGAGAAPRTWDEALAWFYSLEPEDWRLAGEVFGLQHFPADRYINLPRNGRAGISDSLRTVYAGEEKRRLLDFAEQFDGIMEQEFSLLDAIGADRGFDFWRSYLSDKLDLHRRLPGVLESKGSERAMQLAAALDFYSETSDLGSADQLLRYRQAKDLPLVPDLAVLLKPRAIVELFSSPEDSDGVAAVLGSRASRLSRLLEIVDHVNAEHGGSTRNAGTAARLLEDSVRSLPEEELRADVFLLLDLLRGASESLARDVLPALSDETLAFLLQLQPAAARSPEISPARLLGAIGISGQSSLEQVKQGAKVLADNSSGNFTIDAPYDAAIFEHLDRFADSNPTEVIDAVTGSGTRLAPWIDRTGDGALRVMRAEPTAAAIALAGSTGSRETPYRLIHLVAKQDPGLAARLSFELSRTGQAHSDAAARVIMEFAFDLYWSERNAGPNTDPARFGEFLVSLQPVLGEETLTSEFVAAVDQLTESIRQGFFDSSGLDELARTSMAALDAAGGEDRRLLVRVFASAGLVS